MYRPQRATCGFTSARNVTPFACLQPRPAAAATRLRLGHRRSLHPLRMPQPLSRDAAQAPVCLSPSTSDQSGYPLFFVASTGECDGRCAWCGRCWKISYLSRVKLRNTDFKTLRVKGTSPNVDVTCVTQSPHVDFVEWYGPAVRLAKQMRAHMSSLMSACQVCRR